MSNETLLYLITRQTAAFWFIRDLRFIDNAGLFHTLKKEGSIIPAFIFDTSIQLK